MSESTTTGALPTLLRLNDLLSEWEQDATNAHTARLAGIPRGPITGLRKVDESLGGFFEPGLHIIHGTAGAGKTAFALQAACNCGCPVLFVSCEMRALELLRRITARITGTYLGRLKSGEIPPAQSLELARRAAAACSNLCIVDATRATATPKYILERAELIRGNSKDVLIVVDSIHSWSNSFPDEGNEYEALNVALSELRVLSHRLMRPVLGIAERNRASTKVTSKSDNTSHLSAGAGSRKFEYGSESVISLTAEGEPDANGETRVSLLLAKNRNGQAGKKIDLLFSGRLQQFREGGF